MAFLSHCTFRELTPAIVKEFGALHCKRNPEIEEFFKSNFADNDAEMLSKSYCFTNDEEPKQIVCAFSLATSSLRLSEVPNSTRNKINRAIPYPKHRIQYPAVLIAQLAVSDTFAKLSIGDELIGFIKSWMFLRLNHIGRRFIIVDAVNHPKVLEFYQKETNGFKFVFPSEEQEENYMHLTNDKLSTRLMYFDLVKAKQQS